MANKHGIAGGPNDHAEHGNPEVGHADGRLCAIADTQHVDHGFEERIGILLSPRIVLKHERKENGLSQQDNKRKNKCNVATEA